MQIVKTKGNADLMNREKTLFLCSKRTPLELYGHVFEWVDSLTERDCIACFNSTDMEAEVLKALLVARVPTVLFVMNRFTDVNNLQIERALRENRLFISVLKRDEPAGLGATPKLRNEYVLSLCRRVVCGYVNKNGSVFPMLAGREGVVRLIGDKQFAIAAESETNSYRWTVAQDKMLMRMYYADMGIHAIHKKLNRPYADVYARIRSMTQPEEWLKGREFEDYVLNLFLVGEDDQLILQEWQGDKSCGLIQPENNSNPDFVFRYREKEFAIECKWRERLDKDLSKSLFPNRKIENYKRFSEARQMPVTVILGVGCEPCNPELLYSIPLEQLEAVVSDPPSIVNFLCRQTHFHASRFLRCGRQWELNEVKIKEIRRLYPNAYKPWSKKDDHLLISLYRENKSIEELMRIFQRNEGGITSRISKLMAKEETVRD